MEHKIKRETSYFKKNLILTHSPNLSLITFFNSISGDCVVNCEPKQGTVAVKWMGSEVGAQRCHLHLAHNQVCDFRQVSPLIRL